MVCKTQQGLLGFWGPLQPQGHVTASSESGLLPPSSVPSYTTVTEGVHVSYGRSIQ